MTNWLEKIIPQNLQNSTGRNLLNPGRTPRGAQPNILPNASIIYGVAAAALFVIALYYLFFGHSWVKALLIMLPAGCFLGFALHFIKHPH